MITPEKIEEWLREVEERPSSAALIIQYISNRLRDLSQRNEELRAENIELLTGRKVEEYQNRIANLEYQVELLKRQMRAEVPLSADAAERVGTLNLLVYSPQGQVLRLEIPSKLTPLGILANIQDEITTGNSPGLLVTGSQEELLFVFDSGRTQSMPVTDIPIQEGQQVSWAQAFLQEPRPSEELAVILPLSRMSLFEYCMQTSRRGYVKKIKESSFETFISGAYIGKGVRLPLDKMCSLVFGSPQDPFVALSLDGFLQSMPVEQLPVAIEEIMRLGTNDHIVTTFVLGKKPSILIVTQTGKVIHRDVGWLEAAGSYRSRGQMVFSRERHAAGVRAVAAANVDENDWGIALLNNGKLINYPIKNLFASGSLFESPSDSVEPGQISIRVVNFTTFTPLT